MNEWTVKDKDTGDEWHKDSRREAEQAVEEFGDLRDLEIIGPGNDVEPEVVDHTEEAKADGGAVEAEVVEETEEPAPEPPEPDDSDVITGVDDLRENHADLLESDVDVDKDPNNWLPGWMLTEIQHGGQTSVDLNKRGTQVVRSALNLEVNAEEEITGYETDFEYARYRATVKTPDGQTFNAVGDAHIDESGNEKWDLDRLAETRAKKRAVKWSTGGGLEALSQDGVSGQ